MIQVLICVLKQIVNRTMWRENNRFYLHTKSETNEEKNKTLNKTLFYVFSKNLLNFVFRLVINLAKESKTQKSTKIILFIQITIY